MGVNSFGGRLVTDLEDHEYLQHTSRWHRQQWLVRRLQGEFGISWAAAYLKIIEIASSKAGRSVPTWFVEYVFSISVKPG